MQDFRALETGEERGQQTQTAAAMSSAWRRGGKEPGLSVHLEDSEILDDSDNIVQQRNPAALVDLAISEPLVDDLVQPERGGGQSLREGCRTGGGAFVEWCRACVKKGSE